jgi:hypothetical protein
MGLLVIFWTLSISIYIAIGIIRLVFFLTKGFVQKMRE